MSSDYVASRRGVRSGERVRAAGGLSATASLRPARFGARLARPTPPKDELEPRQSERAPTGARRWALLERDADADVLPLCRALNVGFVAYFPLASGLLTGKYTRGEPPREGTRLSLWGGEMLSDGTFDKLDELAAFAEDRGLIPRVAACTRARPDTSWRPAWTTSRIPARRSRRLK